MSIPNSEFALIATILGAIIAAPAASFLHKEARFGHTPTMVPSFEAVKMDCRAELPDTIMPYSVRADLICGCTASIIMGKWEEGIHITMQDEAAIGLYCTEASLGALHEMISN